MWVQVHHSLHRTVLHHGTLVAMRVRPESAEDRPVRQLMKIHLLKESLRVHSEARSISTRQLVSTGGEERV